MSLLVMSAVLGVARADGESETLLSVRHDLFGEPMAPAMQYLSLFEQREAVAVEAAAGLEWQAGILQPIDPDIYTLRVQGDRDRGSWSVGRQQAVAVNRPWTFDGAAMQWHATDRIEVVGWGGIARHQDLDDLRDGAGIGRIEARQVVEHLRTRLGVWWLWEPDFSPALYEDLEISATADIPSQPGARLLLVARDGVEQLVQARGELGIRAFAGCRATAHIEHREALYPDGTLGEGLLDTFAPEGVDDVGVSVRLSDARWAVLSASGALLRYQQPDQPVLGHAAELKWTPGQRGRSLRISPSYRYRAGPGGLFHALWAVADLDLSDASALTIQGALVPYRKLNDPWSTAMMTDIELSQKLGDGMRLTAGLDLASGAHWALDVRGRAGLIVDIP